MARVKLRAAKQLRGFCDPLLRGSGGETVQTGHDPENVDVLDNFFCWGKCIQGRRKPNNL